MKEVVLNINNNLDSLAIQLPQSMCCICFPYFATFYSFRTTTRYLFTVW